MERISRPMWTGGLAVLLSVSFADLLSAQQLQQARLDPQVESRDLQPTDTIKTLIVTISVSDRGADLKEPVALDLGLGFPLWLYPIGWSADNHVPFGAVAQNSTVPSMIPAGTSGTFTFDVSGPPGADALGTTQQLLAGVRICDIKRIGLTSSRTSDWILEGYRLQINGVDFAEDRTGVSEPDAAQHKLATQVTQLEHTLATLRTEYEQLLALDKEKMTDHDRQRIRQIEMQATASHQEKISLESQLQINAKSAKATRDDDLRKLASLQLQLQQAHATSEPTSQPHQSSSSDAAPATRPSNAAAVPGTVDADVFSQPSDLIKQLQQRIHWLQGRLQAQHPWFVDRNFQPLLSPGQSRTSSPIHSITVTLETRTHVGADTQNSVYLCTGGHKYLLNSRYTALSASGGPQQFDVDLSNELLTAADLRGWAVGMIATPDFQSSAPDRWHPQRIIIDVDGANVYDSEDSPLDRQSLAATRLVPPAQFDERGSPVINVCSPREVHVWAAGQGQGLDLVAGGALPLPAANDPSYPAAEAGLTDDDPERADLAEPADTSFTPDYEPFPGEHDSYPDSTWEDYDGGSFNGGDGGGSQYYDFGGSGGGSGSSGSGPGSGNGFGGGGGKSGSGSSSGPLSGSTIAPAPLKVDPTPPSPFQLKRVWISKGWKTNEPFTIDWQVAGDMSGISHFLVSLRVVRPDQTKNLFREVAKPTKVPASQRSCVTLVDPKISVSQPYYYLSPCVTAVTKDPSKQNPQSHAMVGPARAVFPASANHYLRPIPKDYSVARGPGVKMIAPQGPTAGTKPAVWFVNQPETPDARRFAPPTPGSHVAVRLVQGDKVTVRCEVSKMLGKKVAFSGKQQVLAHLGYMGSTTGSYSVDATMLCTLTGQSGIKKYDYPVWKGTLTSGAPLLLVTQTLDAADLGAPVEKAEVRFTFDNGGSPDPQCMAGIFGLRMFPDSFSSNKTVHADLVIDEANSYLVPGDIRLLPGQYLPAIHKPLCLAVTNKGPDDIPASILRDVKVHVKYYLGQYGTAWGDIKTPANRAEVTFGPYRVTAVRELTSNGKWTGPLKAGETLRLVPTPPPGAPPLHPETKVPWLDPDGRLRSTKRLKLDEQNAHKLFMTWASIQTPSSSKLNDDPSNNTWQHTNTTPIVIGQGPLDYEVILCSESSFQGTGASYELNPDTQRQRLVWDLGNEPNKPNLFRKVRSFMLGRRIDLFACDDHHFYDTHSWMPLFEGGITGAFHANLLGQMGSVILCNKRNCGPVGVALTRGTEEKFWKILPPRTFFFPMPPELGTKVKEFPTIASVFNDKATYAHIWRMPQKSDIAGKVAGKLLTMPTGWLTVTLYENANGGGKTCKLGKLADKYIDTSHGWTRWRVNLDGLPWDGSVIGNGIGAPDVAGDVSSLRIELKGSAVQ